MVTVPEDEAVAQFARAMTPFLESPPATGLPVVEAFFRFYRDVRVDGGEPEVGVRLEWGGAGQPRPPYEPAAFQDDRRRGVVPAGAYTSGTIFRSGPERWCVRLMRDLCDYGDDTAALCVGLYFGEAIGDRRWSGMEIRGVGDLDEQIARLVGVPRVAGLLGGTPFQVDAWASLIG